MDAGRSSSMATERKTFPLEGNTAPRADQPDWTVTTVPSRLGSCWRWLAVRLTPGTARRLLLGLLDLAPTELITRPERPLGTLDRDRLGQALAALEAGVPLAYVLGRAAFWDMELAVGPGVLIPRPDTERLVAAALTLELPATARVFEPCTGSGAVALALARERPEWTIVASDLAEPALRYAERNAKRWAAGRIEWRCGDLERVLDPSEHFDLIVCNPPYLRHDDAHLDRLGAEPNEALCAGPLGSELIARLCTMAPAHLRPNGWLLLEHGYDQGPTARAWLAAGGLTAIRTWRDLDGQQERVSGGQNRGKAMPAPAG